MVIITLGPRIYMVWHSHLPNIKHHQGAPKWIDPILSRPNQGFDREMFYLVEES